MGIPLAELEQQLQDLQNKQWKLSEQIALRQLEIAEKQEELEKLVQMVQRYRHNTIKARKVQLEQLHRTPPARTRHEDERRLATSWIRPLTEDEVIIASMPKGPTCILFAAFCYHSSAQRRAAEQQLRLRIYCDWARERYLLQQEIERISQELLDERETSVEYTLRREVTELQREVARLELRAKYREVDIETLKQRVVQARSCLCEQEGKA
jgi:hypothetical protein